MKQKTPQEKKALSYSKDRRNCYGESDKGSRKSIRRNKTFPSRAYRKNINDILQGTIGVIDLEKAEAVDVKAKEIKRRRWKKYPDRQLGKIIKERLEDRVTKTGEEITARKKIRELIENLVIEVEQETDGRWIAEAIELNGVMVYGETCQSAIENLKILASCVIADRLENDVVNC